MVGNLVLVTYFFVGVDWDEIQRFWTYGIDSGNSRKVGSQCGTLFCQATSQSLKSLKLKKDMPVTNLCFREAKTIKLTSLKRLLASSTWNSYSYIGDITEKKTPPLAAKVTSWHWIRSNNNTWPLGLFFLSPPNRHFAPFRHFAHYNVQLAHEDNLKMDHGNRRSEPSMWWLKKNTHTVGPKLSYNHISTVILVGGFKMGIFPK